MIWTDETLMIVSYCQLNRTYICYYVNEIYIKKIRLIKIKGFL